MNRDGRKFIDIEADMSRKADLCLRSALAGDDEYIVDDQEGETGERLLEVAQKELPGAETDYEDNKDDLDDG